MDKKLLLGITTLLFILGASLLTGCVGPVQECQTDEDCEEGYYCNTTSHQCVEKITGNVSDNATQNQTECVGEGESIPGIAHPLECCEGLEVIPPREEDILDHNGFCTAKCGDGFCNSTGIESAYNCPSDCLPDCGDGECQEMVCQALGCPEPETPENCPEDCETPPQPSLEFSVGECNESIDPYNQSQLGVKEQNWTDDNTLEVKAVAAINCAETIQEGGYKATGGQLNLTYDYIPCAELGFCANCMCAHQLEYTVKNIPQAEYDLNLQAVKTKANEPPVEMKGCSNHSDCVAVDQHCCGCNNGGKDTCIHKEYQEEWENYQEELCSDIECLAVEACQSSCSCVNGTCQVNLTQLKEEIELSTGKNVYQQGENVTFYLQGDGSLEVRAGIQEWDIYKKTEEGWTPLSIGPRFGCVHIPTCVNNSQLQTIEACLDPDPVQSPCTPIKNTTRTWNQEAWTTENKMCGNETYSQKVLKQVSPGDYKVKFGYFTDANCTGKKKFSEEEFSIE